ncbi:sodium:proton antiporter [Plantactinospora sp. KBS50]|nr:monovalent cation/H(+) antiporter subunit G [Plantactinospora sp. KBS50]ASW57516.1 sodium:proton antiporter [Plantactinospora sp. KBS50]
MRALADVLSAVCLLAGGLLSFLAAVGLIRFPDVLSRIHAVTKPQILGVLLVLAGVALRLRYPADLGMILLVAVFQLITAPVAAQMIGRAAYRSGKVRRDLLDVDEVAMPPTGADRTAR